MPQQNAMQHETVAGAPAAINSLYARASAPSFQMVSLNLDSLLSLTHHSPMFLCHAGNFFALHLWAVCIWAF